MLHFRQHVLQFGCVPQDEANAKSQSFPGLHNSSISGMQVHIAVAQAIQLGFCRLDNGHRPYVASQQTMLLCVDNEFIIRESQEQGQWKSLAGQGHGESTE